MTSTIPFPAACGRPLQGLVAVALLATAGCALAQAFPTKPIRLVVPGAPGGITDIAARVVANRLASELGQPVYVEDKAGGGGRIGPAEVARSPADGYTLLYANSVGNALLPATSKSVTYDPITDFKPVALLFSYATTLVCHPSVPVNTAQELVEYARKNPGKLTYASAGQGSGNHFTGALFNSMAKVDTLHVPYKGSGPALQDVIAGNVNCTDLGAAKPSVDAGRLKAIATTGLTRDPRFPNLPTLDESGLKGFEMTWWQGVMAPAGTPQAIVDKLEKALRATLDAPEVKARTYEVGLNTTFGNAADFNRAIVKDMEKFKSIAKGAGIVMDE
ncbi:MULTISPECIES: Bug family tripartite tricarboxylate transporter substrate binding protein [Ramlibacter]|uniref:Tripartite tricarboxylate transporter substrate binding protein n=1 Tax=Ramlibacter pinisoli TaxID=2682844 RepID=A0A6N8IQC9_9BURK|nr:MULTISPECIES: tripartite tricarboxylate transporter substrate binding protein [Ramlibacter]MBA2963523.1 tripartite tricarboxylate transporter substrate binding protein [Ramlibacter sp. CGMCC 1.13660]MVQ28490.1 tripartite tricarboxylate transporter substrate binding protein [Ramlibacter pinisoli]